MNYKPSVSNANVHKVPFKRVSAVYQALYGKNCNGLFSLAATINNDIALLKFKEPLNFTDTIQPICVADASFDLQTKALECYTSGWGDLKYYGEERLCIDDDDDGDDDDDYDDDDDDYDDDVMRMLMRMMMMMMMMLMMM